jgi:hypothetical protein
MLGINVENDGDGKGKWLRPWKARPRLRSVVIAEESSSITEAVREGK